MRISRPSPISLMKAPDANHSIAELFFLIGQQPRAGLIGAAVSCRAVAQRPIPVISQ